MLSNKNQAALESWTATMHFHRATMMVGLVSAIVMIAWILAYDSIIIDLICTVAIIIASYVIGTARGKWLEAKLVVRNLQWDSKHNENQLVDQTDALHRDISQFEGHTKPTPPENHPE
jgi:hypothetical protein